MKCQIGEAIEKIDKLISNNSKVDDNTINQLIKVKKKLNSVKDIRMSRMQSNNAGSESKTPEFDKKGFNGYVLIKDTGGKGSAEGDAKDKAMREVADGFIGELSKANRADGDKHYVHTFAPSSTRTSWVAFRDETSTEALQAIEDMYAEILFDSKNKQITASSPYPASKGSVFMLARNGSLSKKPLSSETKIEIDLAHKAGAMFVVGDMPGVDTQFIEYLNKIGASYKVYTTNEAGKEFDRKVINGSKYRNIVETKSQNETKSLEPDVDPNNKYKIISKDDIEAAKDIMSNNKKECE